MRTSLMRICASAIVLFFAPTCLVKAQDTLHLNYHHTQILPHDSTQAKIDKWVKSLNGQHVNIKVIGYFHRPEFKKFSQQRCDELFLVLNRKARNLITIDFIGPKKGEDYQRTMVDIVYYGASVAKPAPVAKAEPAKPAAKSEEKKENVAAKKEEKSENKAAKTEDKAVKKEVKKEEKVTKTAEKPADAPSGGSDPSATNKVNISISGGDVDAAGGPELKENSTAWIIKQEDVKFLREAKIVVARTNNAAANAILEKAINANWTFNGNVTVMDYRAAVEQAKTDKNMAIITIAEVRSEGKDAADIKSVQFGKAVVIEKTKGKVVAQAYMPVFGDEYTEAGAQVAVSAINSLLRGMLIKGLPDNKSISAPYSQWTSQLGNKTLLLPKEWLTPGITAEQIAENYKGKFQVSDLGAIRDAITSKSNTAYVAVTRGVAEGSMYFMHYLVDAQTGLVMSIIQTRNSEGKSDDGKEAYIGSFALSKYNNEL